MHGGALCRADIIQETEEREERVNDAVDVNADRVRTLLMERMRLQTELQALEQSFASDTNCTADSGVVRAIRDQWDRRSAPTTND